EEGYLHTWMQLDHNATTITIKASWPVGGFPMYLIPAAVRSTVVPSLLLLSLAGAAALSNSAHAQNPDQLLPGSEDQIVNILQEPRHRIVHHEGDVWVLDIQINPGDSTKPHTHDSAILYNFISSGEGSSNGRL